MSVFPEVDLYWVLNGTGTFPKSELESGTHKMTSTPTLELKIDSQTDLFSAKNANAKNQIEENIPNLFSNSKVASTSKIDAEIERIVVFYKNGTFKAYSSE